MSNRKYIGDEVTENKWENMYDTSKRKGADGMNRMNQVLFQQYAMEGTEPVLVAFCASWCGYCRRITPALKRLAAHGKTILIVLHDPTLALRHASKIVRMGHGTAEDVLDNRSPDYEKTEASLRVLYPALRVNRDPLFCYTETSSYKEATLC